MFEVLVEVPLCLCSADSHVLELLEGMVREIDGVDFATHAFVDDLGSD